LAHAIVDAATDKKASNIVLLDLRGIILFADYFVLCNGQSVRQLDGVTEGIKKSIKEQGVRPLSVEGKADSGWMVLDFGAVVVHVFSDELRAYYALEDLWRDASVVVHVQ